MSYLEKESVKKIRTMIKSEFKNYKFSITREDYSVLRIEILKSDIDFELDCGKYKQINMYWLDENYKDNQKALRFLKRLQEIINQVVEQETISEDSDYGSIPNYYLNVSAGRWDKPYELIA